MDSACRLTVVASARDIGAGQVLAPVLANLVEVGTKVSAFLAHPANEIFDQRGLPYQPVGSHLSLAELHKLAERIINDRHPDLVLVGTCLGPSLDKELTVSARQFGIPTVGVLDHWWHLWQRFVNLNGGPRWQYLPDRLAVMDEIARDRLLSQGCPPERLVIAGQPYLEEVAAAGPRMCGAGMRRALQVTEDVRLVVFALESRGNDRTRRKWQWEHPTAEEMRRAVAMIRSALRWVARKHGLSVVLILKEHPAEAADWLGVDLDEGLRTILLAKCDPRSLMAAADAVAGMTSMFIFEAAAMGKPTLCLWPIRSRPNPVAELRIVSLSFAHTQRQCRAFLEACLWGGGSARRECTSEQLPYALLRQSVRVIANQVLELALLSRRNKDGLSIKV